MLDLIGPIMTPASAGGAGVSTATVTTTQVIRGEVKGVYLQYNDSPPAGTTDVTLASAGVDHPAETILTISNAATNGWFYPRVGAQTTAGAAMLFAAGGTAVPACIPVADKLTLTIAQANDGDSVYAWVLVEC